VRIRRLVVLALVLVVIGAAAVVVLGRTGSPTEPWRFGRYAHVQLNLCLSGRAACFAKTQYPAVVDDAVRVITAADARSAVLVEACSDDAAAIARRTGMRLTFGTVLDGGRPLACVDPGDRGVYGFAVLTRSAPVAVTDEPFAAQQGSEQRRFVCVTTDADLTVCGAHLALPGDDTAEIADRWWRVSPPPGPPSPPGTSTGPGRAPRPGTGSAATPAARTPACSRRTAGAGWASRGRRWCRWPTPTTTRW
jgi:hypothetical protein